MIFGRKKGLTGTVHGNDPVLVKKLQAKMDGFLAALPPEAVNWRRSGSDEWRKIVAEIGELLGPTVYWTIPLPRGRPPVDEATKAAAVVRSREAAREAMRAKRAATKPKHIYLEQAVSDALDQLMADHPGLNQSEVISLLITDAAERKNRNET